MHALSQAQIDVDPLTQESRQDLVAGSHFRQQHARLQADLLDIGNPFDRELVFEILCDGIRVQARLRSIQTRSAQIRPPDGFADPVDQDRRGGTLVDLLPQHLRVGGDTSPSRKASRLRSVSFMNVSPPA